MTQDTNVPVADADPRRISTAKTRSILRRLSRIDLLRALPPEEAQALVPHVKRKRFPAGSCLMLEGEVGDAVYLVEEGQARVDKLSTGETWLIGPGSALGEGALLTGNVRSATVTAHTDLVGWRISRESFQQVVAASPALKCALEELMAARHAGVKTEIESAPVWVSTALRSIEARSRHIHGWQWIMAVGMALWVALRLNEHFSWIASGEIPGIFAGLNLLTGLLIIQGACESFLFGVERLGARRRWDGFISGTIGSALSTLPEFVVIAFLVLVQPMLAFVTATVTIFNNALAFSIYSFFLPKDRQGAYLMPRSVTEAGGEILIAGGSITLIIGIVMITQRLEGVRTQLIGFDLLGIGLVLIVIYGYYLMTLIRYYGEGKDDEDSVPPDPHRLGHDTSWFGIGSMMATGIAGAYCGGEAIGQFADTAVKSLGMPTIPTAAGLALFAGVSEYIIVYKAHRRGELGIALSNVFGGLTQVMFLLLPFSLVVIGMAGYITGDPQYFVPVNAVTILLMLLLFPLFYALHQCMEQGKSLSNLDAAAMTGIYLLLLYFLLTTPT
ncbi:MAG: Na Ca ex protein [Gammaproteobacteria bacterium]|nr:Na Ca ex protein [Gammaproteobacteria bacterium]